MIGADVFEIVPPEEMPRFYGFHWFPQLPTRGDRLVLRDAAGDIMGDLEVVFLKYWSVYEGAEQTAMVSIYGRRWLDTHD